MNKEIRQIESNFNLDEQGRTVEGYAAVFDTPSKNIGWTEVIHKGAITNETIIDSDIFALFNHDEGKVLARSNHGEGSLLLEVDNNGLRYLFDSPKTALGDELLEYLKRGDIKNSSFAFSVSRDANSERWYKQNGEMRRDIYKIERLYDVSPVFSPAYEATSCSKRYEEVKATSEEIDKQMNIYKEEIEKL